MPIQIGLRCSPNWLCDGLSWLLAGIAMLLFVGLVLLIRRERNSRGTGRYPIQVTKKTSAKKTGNKKGTKKRAFARFR